MRIPPTAPLAALSLALLTACATPVPAPDTGSHPVLPPLPKEDTCRAATYADRLGDDYRTLPAAPEGAVFRVVCTTCPMTMDFNAQRLNFFYEESTGKVVRLSCG